MLESRSRLGLHLVRTTDLKVLDLASLNTFEFQARPHLGTTAWVLTMTPLARYHPEPAAVHVWREEAQRLWDYICNLAVDIRPKLGFPAEDTFEDAEFGVRRPHAEPGPPPDADSYSPVLSEIDESS